MLYSHNLENEKLNLFTLFLNKALQGDESYASIVNEVILETHKYVAGERNLYNVNRDSINIILLLAGLEKEYFKNLTGNPKLYDKEIYSKVLNVIKNHKPILVY
jgi:hypothetical protein